MRKFCVSFLRIYRTFRLRKFPPAPAFYETLITLTKSTLFTRLKPNRFTGTTTPLRFTLKFTTFIWSVISTSKTSFNILFIASNVSKPAPKFSTPRLRLIWNPTRWLFLPTFLRFSSPNDEWNASSTPFLTLRSYIGNVPLSSFPFSTTLTEKL